MYYFYGEYKADSYAKNGHFSSVGRTCWSVVDKEFLAGLGDSCFGIWCAEYVFRSDGVIINTHCHPVRRFSEEELSMVKRTDGNGRFLPGYYTLFDGLGRDSEAGNLAVRRVMHYMHLNCDLEDARQIIMQMIIDEELPLETAVHFAGLPVRSTPTTARLYPGCHIKLGESFDSLLFVDSDNFDPDGAEVEIDANNCARWAKALPSGFSVTTDGHTVKAILWDESRFEFTAPGIYDLDDDYLSAWYIDVNPKDGRHSFCLLFDRSEENKKTVARLLGVA